MPEPRPAVIRSCPDRQGAAAGETSRWTIPRPCMAAADRTAEISTYRIEELLGTKLRALFQRKKGRDLFDLVVALEAGIDPAAIVEVFRAYLKADGREITRAIFEENLDGKLRLPAFTDDVPILLPPGTSFDFASGVARVATELVAKLPGEPWKGRAPHGRTSKG